MCIYNIHIQSMCTHTYTQTYIWAIAFIRTIIKSRNTVLKGMHTLKCGRYLPSQFILSSTFIVIHRKTYFTPGFKKKKVLSCSNIL